MKGDKNNIFFNMIHYILSEQSNVDWILKSSLINFTGLQTEVSFSKFQKPNLINDIMQYINYVKPYHTKFDQFIEKYTSKNDKLKIRGDRKETTDGTFIVIHNLVEFFNITHKMRFDNVSLTPDIKKYEKSTSLQDKKKFWDTTSANRLYANTTKNLDKISEILKGGFKGLTVDGGDFLLDAYGYDNRPYDSSLYDAPNITNDYYIVNHTETDYDNYVKEFTKVNLNLLKTNHPYRLSKNKIKIYSYYNNIRTEIIEYNIMDDIINIFRGIRKFEKIIITVSETNDLGAIVKYNYIYVGVDFFEEVAPSGNKKFSEYGTIRFKLPDADYGLKSLRVYLIDPDGSKNVLTNYIKDGEYIQLYNIPEEFYTISITIVDYSFLYDRIYSYEDTLASQNNLMYIDGEGFLRPHWDKYHPSELTIARGKDCLFVKKYTEEGKPIDQHYFDVWHNDTYSDWDNGEKTELAQPLKMGDNKIHVRNGKIFEKPYVNKDGIKVPGLLFIENEIIEFYEISGNTLTSIKRATRGSSFKTTYPKGTVCWDYAKNNTTKSEASYDYIGHQLDGENTIYQIPGDIKATSKIDVYKTKKVNMLNDLTPESQYVNFDQPILANTNEVKITYTVNDFFKVSRNSVLGIKLGEINEPLNIGFSEDIDNIQDVARYISSKIPSGYTLRITTNGETITFNSYAGNSLLIYNVNGYPVQEIFDCTDISDTTNPTVQCNGEDGIVINGYKIIWGNYAHTIKWLKENPYEGDVNEMILSINKNTNVRKQVIARNNNNHIELISINGKNITLEAVGETSLEDLGLKEISVLPPFITYNENYNSVAIYQERAGNAGSVVISGKTIYFYVYTEYMENGQTYSRIQDIRTDQTIKKDDAIIMTPVAYQLKETIDYTIENDNIVLLQTPNKYEALYITNNF